MNIVVLDGYTLNPGDLNWQKLEVFGNLQIYDRTPADQVISRAKSAEAVFTNKTVLSADTLKSLPNIKYIGVLATGYDVIDTKAASSLGITVTNVPGYGPDSVAQMVFSHILHFTNNVAGHNQDVIQGGWSKTPDYCYWLSPQVELKDKVLGVIGYGEIGKATAKIGEAFGMSVLIYTRTVPDNLPGNMRHVELDELLTSADFISLHCPLTDQTNELINGEKIRLMKNTAILINCSRGPLIDEEALATALNHERIRGAGLDVLSEEPVRKNNPLIGAKNCVITPHIAWATREARSRLMAIAVDNFRVFLAGGAKNRIA